MEKVTSSVMYLNICRYTLSSICKCYCYLFYSRCAGQPVLAGRLRTSGFCEGLSVICVVTPLSRIFALLYSAYTLPYKSQNISTTVWSNAKFCMRVAPNEGTNICRYWGNVHWGFCSRRAGKKFWPKISLPLGVQGPRKLISAMFYYLHSLADGN